MFRIFAALAAIIILGAGFALLADSPAQLILLLPGWRISLSPAAGAAALLLAAATILLIISFIRFLLAPLGWRSAWQRYKKANAYKNLAEGLIAGFSGDAAAAKLKQALSANALPWRKEPLSALASAQISVLAREEAAFFSAPPAPPSAEKQAEILWLPLLGESAAQNNKSAAPSPELQLLALKMLYDQAGAAKDETAAHSYAAAAAQLSPACLWASLAATEAKIQQEDWQAAQNYYDNFCRARARQAKQDSSGMMEKTLARGKQILLCGRAGALFARQPRQARYMALEAHKIDESFSPAAVLAAEILFRLEESRKAEKLALNAFQNAPQADLALAYICGGGTVKSAAKQAARARKLAELCPEEPAANSAAAKLAYQTGDYQAAQKFAEKAAAKEPARQSFILLAELAAQRGAAMEAARLLAQALAAAPEKAWCADGRALAAWQALSPVSRRLGGCKWQTPPHMAITEAELKTLLAALETKPQETESASGQERSAGRRKAEQAKTAPLHGFAPPEKEKEEGAGSIYVNVDNPGIERAEAKTEQTDSRQE